MKDSHLEILALIGIIAGLFILFFFVLDYKPKDAFFLTEEDGNVFLEGKIQKNSFNENSGITFLEISSCRNFRAFYEGKINASGDIKFNGEYRQGVLEISELSIHN